MDLNTLIAPGSGWELLEAVGINDSGQIAGTGQFRGRLHAFLLNPRRGNMGSADPIAAGETGKPFAEPSGARVTALHAVYGLPAERSGLDWVHLVMRPCR